MPKLIIKQEIERVSWVQEYAKPLSLAGMLLLTLVVGFIAWSNLTVSYGTAVAKGAPSLETASDLDVRADYLRQNTELNAMALDYERQAALMPADEAGNTRLKDAAERILQHVFNMDDAMLAMGLKEEELLGLQQRQYYLQDLWQSRVTFAELRLQRMRDLAQVNTQVGDVSAVPVSEPAPEGVNTQGQVAAKVADGGHVLAEPPPGMELPSGFCTLSGPNACKPE